MRALAVELLSRHVTPDRWLRMQKVASLRTDRVRVVCENLRNPRNVSAVLRTAEAFGLRTIHWIEETPTQSMFLPSVESTGASRWLQLNRHRSVSESMNNLKANGFDLWLADANASHSLADIELPPKVAILFGNERHGPSETARSFSSGSFVLPMRGFVTSFNVSVSVAIALQSIDQRGLLTPSLSSDEKTELLLDWLVQSVGLDTSRKILKHHNLSLSDFLSNS